MRQAAPGESHLQMEKGDVSSLIRRVPRSRLASRRSRQERPGVTAIRIRWVSLFAAGAAMVILIFYLAMFYLRLPQGVVQIGGPFALTDSDGQTVTDRSFRGKWMLVYFGYTYCPDVCPTTLNEIAEVLARLGDGAKAITPVFITVDPERDTTAVLRAFVKAFDPRIVGLTGSPAAIAAAAKAYKVYYEKSKTGNGPQDYLVDHTALIYLMRPDGRFETYFSPDATADDIVRGLRRLIPQATAGGAS
jgi:protein SCO1/2